MRSVLRIIPAALLVLGVAPAGASAQQLVGRNDSVYVWRGAIPAGGVFTVSNFNGPIDVRPATGGTAELRAEKRTGRGGRVSDVAFEVQRSSNGDVRICSTQEDDPCEGSHRRNHDDDDGWRRHVTVAMTVLVPRGVQLHVATGNGALSIERAGSEVRASTGNGRVHIDGTEGVVQVSTGNGDVNVRNAKASVRVTTGNGNVDVSTAEGPVDARSGNGDIDVKISTLRAKDDMAFHTGSGSVHLTLPANYSGELDATTGNGSIRSDFDLKVKGQLSPRHVRATIGEGGPMLRLTTGNGEFDIRKG